MCTASSAEPAPGAGSADSASSELSEGEGSGSAVTRAESKMKKTVARLPVAAQIDPLAGGAAENELPPTALAVGRHLVDDDIEIEAVADHRGRERERASHNVALGRG